MNTYGSINYFSKIFNFTNELVEFSLSFKENMKEERYDDYFENFEKKKSIVFSFYLSLHFSTLYIQHYQ